MSKHIKLNVICRGRGCCLITEVRIIPGCRVGSGNMPETWKSGETGFLCPQCQGLERDRKMRDQQYKAATQKRIDIYRRSTEL